MLDLRLKLVWLLLKVAPVGKPRNFATDPKTVAADKFVALDFHLVRLALHLVPETNKSFAT